MKKQTTAQLRKSNHNLVRNVMLTEEAWTKEALAAATGLSRSTCYNILMDMLAAGEAAELSHGASTAAVPPAGSSTAGLPCFLHLCCFNVKTC